MGWRLLLLALAVSLAPACAGSAPSRVICGQCEEEDRFVRLHARGDAAGPDRRPLAHPLTLSPEDWRPILRSLRVQSLKEGFPLLPASKSEPIPAFTEEDVAYLSETLAKAFGRAGTDDWVVFALVRRPPDVGTGISEVTTGAWYVEGRQLHLLLVNYRFPVTMPAVRDQLWDQPLYAYPPFYAVAAGDFQTLQRRSALRQFIAADLPEVIIDYQPLLLAGTLPRPPRPPDAQGAGAPPPSPAPAPMSVEESLEALKRWRDKGLITEEEYQAKKRQVLERF